MKLPRIMIAAPKSGGGKTLITCGLLQALKNRENGRKSETQALENRNDEAWELKSRKDEVQALKDRENNVQAFKCGPDYIDPMFHTRVIGTPSRNLDPFFTDPETLRYLFARQAKNARISVIEGVMGYYDGLAGIDTVASSYDLARITRTPVIFVVNARGMSLSVLPLIKGFLEYRKDSNIKGVILNQISPSIYPDLKRLIEGELPVKVFGYLPILKDCVIESRHLGLVMPEEIENMQEKLMKLASQMEKSIDIDGILALADQACDYPDTALEMPEKVRKYVSGDRITPGVKLAVALDEAFCFYYADNLQLLQDMGAELIFFSPIHDRKIPYEADALLIGGGYPELYARQLSENKTMLSSIKNAIAGSLPYLAECGGFMYLHETMEGMEEAKTQKQEEARAQKQEEARTQKHEEVSASQTKEDKDEKSVRMDAIEMDHGKVWPMVGVIRGNVVRTDKLGRFGYIDLTAREDTVYGPAGTKIRAHEFHYFDSSNNGGAFHAQKPLRKRNWDCILAGENYAAGFPHMYYYSNPEIVHNFLKKCRE